jgi:hypothetical protein
MATIGGIKLPSGAAMNEVYAMLDKMTDAELDGFLSEVLVTMTRKDPIDKHVGEVLFHQTILTIDKRSRRHE